MVARTEEPSAVIGFCFLLAPRVTIAPLAGQEYSTAPQFIVTVNCIQPRHAVWIGVAASCGVAQASVKAFKSYRVNRYLKTRFAPAALDCDKETKLGIRGQRTGAGTSSDLSYACPLFIFHDWLPTCITERPAQFAWVQCQWPLAAKLDERKNPEQFPYITCKRESQAGQRAPGKRLAAENRGQT